MSPRTLIIILAASMLATAGCGKNDSKFKKDFIPVETGKFVMPAVEDEKLAKVILKSETRLLKITRDPFKPLVSQGISIAPGSGNDGAMAAEPEDSLEDVQVLGVVIFDGSPRAYCRVGNKGQVLRIDDKLRKYTVVSIALDKVVFQSGKDEIVKDRAKKRGKQ